MAEACLRADRRREKKQTVKKKKRKRRRRRRHGELRTCMSRQNVKDGRGE